MTQFARAVDQQQQQQFAAFSGDLNPMHMDAVAARRTQAGAPVVHGVHTLLWALESLATAGRLGSSLLRIRVKFLKWVYLGDEAALQMFGDETVPASGFQVTVQGLVVLSGDLIYGPASVEPRPAVEDGPTSPLPLALDLTMEQLRDRTGPVYTAPSTQAEAGFPHLSSIITPAAVAEIAATSYIVGMVAPGLHSTFSQLDVTLLPAQTGQGALSHQVVSVDERFRKCRVAFTGRAIEGSLVAFVRVPPVQQASMDLLTEYVQPGEFRGVDALIIGGSRGLGELTAKLIAKGGGTVRVTYALGKAEAEGVRAEIEAAGGHAQAFAYDARKPATGQLDGLTSAPTHLFYFATQTIYKPKTGILAPETIAGFTQIYLQGFYDLCVELLEQRKQTAASGKLKVFYPSTVFIDQRPAGMTEYAMIKAAGEQLCADLNTYFPELEVHYPRLPKLATDQTAGVLPERQTDAIEALLPTLRKMI